MNRTVLRDSAQIAGAQVDDLSSAEAFALTNLDWTVETHPVVAVVGDTVLPVLSEGVPVRVQAGEAPVLLKGRVGTGYRVFQNRDAWDATVEAMHGEGFTSAVTGFFGRGERVWIQFRKPDILRASDEEVARFVTYTGFHDGNGSSGWNGGVIQIICSNTFMQNVAAEAESIRFTHVQPVPTVAQIREALGLQVQADTEFEAMVAQLLTVKADDRLLLDTADAVLGSRPNPGEYSPDEAGTRLFDRDRASYIVRNATLVSIFGGPTVKWHGTGWGALSAISEYVEHHAPGGEAQRASRTLKGTTVDTLAGAARLLALA